MTTIERALASRPDAIRSEFDNLLYAAMLTCHASLALLAVAEADRRWTTIKYGSGSCDVTPDDDWLRLVGGADGPVEIVDLLAFPQLAGTGVADGPTELRYVYGLPLRDGGQPLFGVLCVFDRYPRQMSIRERRGLAVIAAKTADRLAVARRVGGVHYSAAPRASDPEPGARADRLSPAAHAIAATAVPPHNEIRLVDRDHGGTRLARAEHPAGMRHAGIAEPDLKPLLHTKDVAVLFDVTVRTVGNWAKAGRLPSFRTPGGQIRFRRDDVSALLGSQGHDRNVETMWTGLGAHLGEEAATKL